MYIHDYNADRMDNMTNQIRLIILTIILLIIYVFFHSSLTLSERRLYSKILDAQKFLWQQLGNMGLELDEETDPYHSGFIGVEYSEITTTMGSLSAKQCSTDPLWAVQFVRWFGELGLTRGDKVLVSASSSFPGMVYACLAACESMGLDVRFLLSLGASTWGANRPELNFSGMLEILRRGGYVKVRPSMYTLGGTNENADGMDDEAKRVLQGSVRDDELVKGLTLDELVALKSEYLSGVRVLVNIGGNASSMGTDTMSLNLNPGIVYPSGGIDGGNGLAGNALRANIPVIHVLNLRLLAEDCGIDFTARHRNFTRNRSIFGGILSAVIFGLFMITHKRWRYE